MVFTCYSHRFMLRLNYRLRREGVDDLAFQTFRKSRKQRYYDISDILEKKAHYNYILSGRSTGKSYQVKKHALKKFLDTGECFFYLRRYKDDINKRYAITYFQDLLGFLDEYTQGEYNWVTVDVGCFFICHIDLDGNITNKKRAGYIRSLSESGRIKSNNYDDVTTIIFEEFVDEQGRYIAHEIEAFVSIVSTVSRRDAIQVFMIGNMLSRSCPYFFHHQLTRVPKQEPGTIDIYDQYTNPPQYDADGNHIYVRIAVEIVEDKSNNTHMYVGTTQKNTSTSTWDESEQPTIKLKKTHQKVYTVFFEREYLKFIADFYVDTETGDCFWFVTNKETELRITKTMRVISDRIYNNPMCTNSLTPLNSREVTMFDYFKENKVYFSNNLCGTEFKRCLTWYRSAHYLL